jgi:cytochrome c-type biogenesis protein
MEMGGSLTYPLAFIAGVTSFLSPCILPLIPSYLAYMAGDAQQKTGAVRVRRSLMFVAGFGTIFVFLGASFGLFGSVLSMYMSLWGKVAGAVVVIFGIHYMGVIRLPFLMRERRIHLNTGSASSIKSYLLGAAFGFGWTPCVGPILASILFLASQTQTLMRGVVLLAIYSIGLGIPFMTMAFGYERMNKGTDWFRRHMKLISILSGGLLVVIGLFIFFGTLQNFTGWVVGLGARLAQAPESKRVLFDTVFSVVFLMLGIIAASTVFIRKRRLKNGVPWTGIVITIILFSAGIVGISGLLTPTRFFAVWLSWQGL